MYVETPKCASTGIKRALALTVSQSLGEEAMAAADWNAHAAPAVNPFVKPFHFEASELTQYMRKSDVVRFTCVRDPYVRFVSAFADKVLGDSSVAKPFLQSLPRSRSQESLFARFVDWVEGTSDEDRDPHWRSQFALIGSGQLTYTHILEFERLRESWSDLQVRLPGLVGLPSHESSGVVQRVSRRFESRFRERVEAMYPSDRWSIFERLRN